jgi:protoporphyrinogen oxidase
MRVGIIGSGPAGITCAYELAKRGIEVDVFESAPQVGGMSRSIKLWGQTVDLGPHRFFSSDKRVNRLWLEVAGYDYKMINRLTRILYRGRLFYYPLKAANALRNLGFYQASYCVLSYLIARLSKPPKEDTFENWVASRFGRQLFRIFFKTYTEKLWGISTSELDSDFAAQRIKGLSLFEAIKDSLLGGGSNKHKTLVNRFAYPVEGTGVIYERMRAKIIANGGHIHLNAPVKGIIVEDGVCLGLALENGERRIFDQVVSSMPLTLMAQSINEMPIDVKEHLKYLSYRNTVLVYLNIEGTDLFPDNWLYVHEENLLTGRITNFSNWGLSVPESNKNTILALEYWCNDDEDVWSWSDERFKQIGKDEIDRSGLIKGARVLDAEVIRLHRSYPVYHRGYKSHLVPIQTWLKTIKGLFPIGRYGAYKYNNQDHSILMGLLAAENITDGKGYDLWAINTDYDNYQESTIIDETGLVEQSKV